MLLGTGLNGCSVSVSPAAFRLHSYSLLLSSAGEELKVCGYCASRIIPGTRGWSMMTLIKATLIACQVGIPLVFAIGCYTGETIDTLLSGKRTAEMSNIIQ